MGRQPKRWHFILVGIWVTAVFLTACNSNTAGDTNVPTLDATQQAIADVLTYQAENPRATRTPDRWLSISKTATAEMQEVAAVEPTLNATQEAIAAVLTYQAENPRPTATRWQGVNVAMTAQAKNRQTSTPSPTVGPTSTPTLPPTPQPRTANVTIPAGTEPQLDGRFTPGEWDDAASQTIVVSDQVNVSVHFKHDAANLFVAFDGLDQGETALFPELLLDAGYDSNLSWNADDFWFHVSTSSCQGSGPGAQWQQCGPADGWRTTDFSQSLATIEMQIPYALLGLQSGSDQPVAISWAVMQLTPDDEERRTFWPATAVFDRPVTWAKGTAVAGW